MNIREAWETRDIPKTRIIRISATWENLIYFEYATPVLIVNDNAQITKTETILYYKRKEKELKQNRDPEIPSISFDNLIHFTVELYSLNETNSKTSAGIRMAAHAILSTPSASSWELSWKECKMDITLKYWKNGSN